MGKKAKTQIRYPAEKKAIYTYGEGSLLDLKSQGKITTGDFVVGMYIERHSDWDSGYSRHLYVQKMMKAIQLSERSIYRCIQRLIHVGWMRKLTPKRCEYMQFHWGHHDKEEHKKRPQNAYPMGSDYDPFNLLAEGKIDHEAFLAFFHMNIGWQKTLGTCQPKSIRNWAKQIGISARKLWGSLKGLKQTLISVISAPGRTSIFHLRFFPSPKNSSESERSTVDSQRNEVRVTWKDGNILCFGNDKYKVAAEGFFRWMAPVGKWIFVAFRVPADIIDFCRTQKESIKSMPNTL